MIHLTDPEIDALPAGRQIDTLIAAEIMFDPEFKKLVKKCCSYCGGWTRDCDGCRFSEFTHAAHSLIDRLAVLGFWCRTTSPFTPGSLHFSGFTPHGTSGWNGRPDHESGGESFELSVARAALKAVAAKQRQEAMGQEEVTA